MPSTGYTLQPFTSIVDISILVKNSWVGQKNYPQIELYTECVVEHTALSFCSNLYSVTHFLFQDNSKALLSPGTISKRLRQRIDRKRLWQMKNRYLIQFKRERFKRKVKLLNFTFSTCMYMH